MQYTRGPQIVGRAPSLGRKTFHSVSRNNLHFHFKFAILIRQKKMRPFRPTVLCAKFHRNLCTKIATANSMPGPKIHT